jgi:hypothetical protein
MHPAAPRPAAAPPDGRDGMTPSRGASGRVVVAALAGRSTAPTIPRRCEPGCSSADASRFGGTASTSRPRCPGVRAACRHPDRLEPWLDELARHFGEAGPPAPERAVDYAVLAAEAAASRLAYDEAVRLLALRERSEPTPTVRHASGPPGER